MDISAFRLFGVLIGLILILIGVLALRKAQPNPAFISTIVFGGVGISVVALFPELATILNDVLSIGAYPGSRLIALLLVAIVLLWILFSFQEARLVRNNDQLDKLIRYNAIREFSQAPSLSEQLEPELRPRMKEDRRGVGCPRRSN